MSLMTKSSHKSRDIVKQKVTWPNRSSSYVKQTSGYVLLQKNMNDVKACHYVQYSYVYANMLYRNTQ